MWYSIPRRRNEGRLFISYWYVLWWYIFSMFDFDMYVLLSGSPWIQAIAEPTSSNRYPSINIIPSDLGRIRLPSYMAFPRTIFLRLKTLPSFWSSYHERPNVIFSLLRHSLQSSGLFSSQSRAVCFLPTHLPDHPGFRAWRGCLKGKVNGY